MKKLTIEYDWNGLALVLYNGEFYCGEVRVNSGGYFEKVWGAEPHPRFPEERLLGQTALESKLKYLSETGAKLWDHDENHDWIYIGFENNEGLDEFLDLANKTFDELKALLCGEYEVTFDCRMEREYWLSGDKRHHGQKKRIKLMFDYGTWCLWLYDEYYGFISAVRLSDNGVFQWSDSGDGYPEELLKGQTELMEMIDRLTEKYEGLFINNEYEFSYKGFENKRDAEEFVVLLNDVWSRLKALLGGKYKLYLREPLDLDYWYSDVEGVL